jgi:hypothetical protein
MRWLLLIGLFVALPAAHAQNDDAVVVTAVRDPVDKSYRRMVRGMEVFEKRKQELAPNAALRFKMLPRRANSRLHGINLEIVGDSFAEPIDVAADDTFTVPRNRVALKENASVLADRKELTMTWRADVRTPGLPAGTRRLGDLRLECAVGMEAGLVSNVRSPLGRLASTIFESADYCNRERNRYLFFADRPLFRVTLAAGERREDLPAERLWGAASVDPNWKRDLRYCDCEVLMDRAYFMPLGDASWPDDTIVHFEYMDDAPDADRVTKAEVGKALGKAEVVDFASGYDVWVYPQTGFVVLFAPDGMAAKARREKVPSQAAARK